MGWKAIKDAYRIGHIVQVRKGNIIIGSPYISELLTVRPDGTVHWPRESGPCSNEDVRRYHREMEAEPARVRELFHQPNTFTAAIPVWTYDGATIRELKAEKLGWPNITHCGELQYDNTHFPERQQAIDAARRNAESSVSVLTDRVNQRIEELTKARAMLREQVTNLATLNQLHAST